MTEPLPPSAQRVQDALAEKGFDNRVVVMPGTTRTSAEAAVACGCTVGQIAKTAGMSTALAHHYFGGKNQIFLAPDKVALNKLVDRVVHP